MKKLILTYHVLFRYSINQAQPDDSFPFNLDEATGQIWTSRTLDRDSRRSNPKWNFAVVASNPYKGNGPSQPVMAQVTIELLDKNDNKPTIKAIRPATSSTHKVRKGTEKYIPTLDILLELVMELTIEV